MRISLITPTADQPAGIALCERWIARQTVQPDEWIVADDGIVPATLSMGQQHLARTRQHEGAQSLAANILVALETVTGDIVIVVEHDDHYAPNHIEVCVDRLKTASATGARQQRYYNVEHRCWILMQNIGSSLCNTAFRADQIPKMQAAGKAAFQRKAIGLDRLFWDSLRIGKDVHGINTVVGIKGLPGRKGLGMGHRPGTNGRRWTPDPDLRQLRAWIGDDVQAYGC